MTIVFESETNIHKKDIYLYFFNTKTIRILPYFYMAGSVQPVLIITKSTIDENTSN
jgi:hypothetical protein